MARPAHALEKHFGDLPLGGSFEMSEAQGERLVFEAFDAAAFLADKVGMKVGDVVPSANPLESPEPIAEFQSADQSHFHKPLQRAKYRGGIDAKRSKTFAEFSVSQGLSRCDQNRDQLQAWDRQPQARHLQLRFPALRRFPG